MLHVLHLQHRCRPVLQVMRCLLVHLPCVEVGGAGLSWSVELVVLGSWYLEQHIACICFPRRCSAGRAGL